MEGIGVSNTETSSESDLSVKTLEANVAAMTADN